MSNDQHREYTHAEAQHQRPTRLRASVDSVGGRPSSLSVGGSCAPLCSLDTVPLVHRLPLLSRAAPVMGLQYSEEGMESRQSAHTARPASVAAR